jgi:hypothetical protein
MVRLALALLFVAACGPRPPATCIDICLKRNHCSSVMPVDCNVWCGMREGANKTAGCTVEYQELLNCNCVHDDQVCMRSGTPCDASYNAYQSCMATYCVGSPLPSGC